MRTLVRTETTTSTAVGTTFLFAAGLAAAAGFLAMRQAPIGPELHITPSLVSPDRTVLVGTQNVSALAVDFLAKRESLFLSELTFTTNDPSTQSQFTACELWTSDGTTIAPGESFNAQGAVVFHNLSLVVPAEKKMGYQLVCDVADKQLAESIKVEYLFALDQPKHVIATTLEKVPLSTSDIHIKQRAEQRIIVGTR